MGSLKENFGARIQEIRKSKKLTQEKLAEKIGLDTPNLSNIERGKRFVSAETLEKIACALNISEKDLFDFKHFQSKENLISDINEVLNNSSEKEVQLCYKFIVNLKQLM